MPHKPIDWIGRSRGLRFETRDFVAGRWCTPKSGSLEKFSPRDGNLLCCFGEATSAEIDQIVSTTRHAYDDGRWSRLPVQRRKEILYRLAALIEHNAEEFALRECLDVGKPISNALQVDVPAAAACIRFSAEASDKCYGKVFAVDQTSLSYDLLRPMGVVAAIVGWNFPLHLAAQKIGPILATGNTLLLKPSELTSFSASRVAELAIEAGVPEGVFNVVNGGAQVGAALARHPGIDCLSFTGSCQTGKRVLIASGESNMKRLVLECGGKAPNIVFDDCADLTAAADAIVTSAFRNQGQVCVASSRLLVQSSIRSELLEAVIQRAAMISIGDPLDSRTQYGALISREHKNKVLNYIAVATREGAVLAYQGSDAPPFENGFYIPPTIFDRVLPQQRIAQEEIFGPVLSVITFRDEAEAVEIANGTIYGLSATLWTRDAGRAHRVSQSIDAGMITVNSAARAAGGPSDDVLSVGGHKQSGIGVEGGIDGLGAYLRRSVVQIFS